MRDYTQEENALAKYILQRESHFGRDTETMLKIAKKSGLSVHTVQSLANGRRALNDSNKKALRKALGNGFQFK